MGAKLSLRACTFFGFWFFKNSAITALSNGAIRNESATKHQKKKYNI